VKQPPSGRERPVGDTVHNGTPQVTATADAKAQDKHRVPELPAAQGHQGPRPLPRRRRRRQAPVAGHHQHRGQEGPRARGPPGRDRQALRPARPPRRGTARHGLARRPQRARHRLPRPPGQQQLDKKNQKLYTPEVTGSRRRECRAAGGRADRAFTLCMHVGYSLPRGHWAWTPGRGRGSGGAMEVTAMTAGRAGWRARAVPGSCAWRGLPFFGLPGAGPRRLGARGPGVLPGRGGVVALSCCGGWLVVAG
jgi:hypothetical protein